jgi:hypothetical protein
MEALILVVTLDGPTMFARIGVMRALNRSVARVFWHVPQGSSLGTAEAGEGLLILRQRVAGTNPPSTA